jgi:hypothetical protein
MNILIIKISFGAKIWSLLKFIQQNRFQNIFNIIWDSKVNFFFSKTLFQKFYQTFEILSLEEILFEKIQNEFLTKKLNTKFYVIYSNIEL